MNKALTTIDFPADVELALNYVREPDRAEMIALMRFDRTLASTVTGARDPALAQLRLAWWRTQLDAPVAGSEGYDAAATHGAKLLPMIDGWEELLAPLPLDEVKLRSYAEGRGGGLFNLLGGDPAIGAGWALADFARHCSDDATRTLARTMADTVLAARFYDNPKPLRVLANLARRQKITRWNLLRAALG